jgi:hypothetical protein
MRVLFKIFCFFILLYVALWGITYAAECWYTAEQDRTHNLVQEVETSIYANTPQYAAYGLEKINNYPRQLFILGGSVAGWGFGAKNLMKAFPTYRIHNLGVATSNITQMAQVVRLIEERISISQLESTAFIINGHFVSFADNETLFGKKTTKLQDELLRHKLFVLDGEFVKPVLWDGVNPVLVKELMKPINFLYTIKYRLWRSWGKLKIALSNFIRRPNQQAAPWSPRCIESRISASGYSDTEFRRFEELVDSLRAKGAKVLFVDDPIATFFVAKSKVYAEYRRRVYEILDRKHIPTFDMSGLSPDSDFTDEVHPTAEASIQWTQALKRYLSVVL